MRPTRIGLNEGSILLEARLRIVAAQDYPLGELARDRIADGLGSGVGFRTLALARRLDHLLDCRDISVRGGGRGCDGERACGRTQQRLKLCGAANERPAKADIGLSEGRQ